MADLVEMAARIDLAASVENERSKATFAVVSQHAAPYIDNCNVMSAKS